MPTNVKCNILALHAAIDAGKIREVETLIENGENVHYIDNWATTPLEHAVEVGNIEIVKILLKAGASMYFGVGCTPVAEAIKIARIDIIKVFIDAGLDLNYELEGGCTFLIEAILTRNLDIVKFLVENGANINVVRADGKSALMCAAIWGGLEIFNYIFVLSSSVIREQATKEIENNLIVSEPVNNQLSEEILF
jgi:ankyrin repeat protein